LLFINECYNLVTLRETTTDLYESIRASQACRHLGLLNSLV